LTLYAFKNGHKFELTQALFIQFEASPSCSKCLETADMLCSNNPIRRHSAKISHVWFPL